MDLDPVPTHVLRDAYGLGDASLRLINESENRTGLVERDGAPLHVLRRYRDGHRSAPEVVAELAWMSALRDQKVIDVPAIVPARTGALMAVDGNGALYALFEHVGGSEPPESELVRRFGELGDICARLHLHSAGWRLPPGTTRPRLDYDSLIGARPVWGPWQGAPGLDAGAAMMIERAAAKIAAELEGYGCDAGRFGLIHGDLRLANLLVDGARLWVIDFDDCAFGWHLYDLATALSLVEDNAEAPDAVAAWLGAYDAVKPLSPEDRGAVPHLVAMRRIQVLSWFASHAETDLAREFGPDAIAGTVAAMDRYLRGDLPFGSPAPGAGGHPEWGENRC
jgi:Ser/Thr protein kinase RdoA (MazF antagonist)